MVNENNNSSNKETNSEPDIIGSLSKNDTVLENDIRFMKDTSPVQYCMNDMPQAPLKRSNKFIYIILFSILIISLLIYLFY